MNEKFINRYVNLYLLVDDTDLIEDHYDKRVKKCLSCHDKGKGHVFLVENEIVCRRCTERSDVLDFIAWRHFIPRNKAVAWLNEFSEKE